MIVTNVTQQAREIWAALPGPSYLARKSQLKSLLTELRHVRDADRPRDRRTRPRLPAAELAVAAIIGRVLGKLGRVTLPVAGLNTPTPMVFRCAEINGHPLQASCAAFLREHRLGLKRLEQGGPPSFVVIRTEGDDQ